MSVKMAKGKANLSSKTRTIIHMKDAAQIEVLKSILADPFTPYTRALRRECVLRTGLRWCQVYKWNFDRITLNRQREAKRLRPIFRVEKVKRILI
jgi:hypothetical protein